jgi:hypothetical protein
VQYASSFAATNSPSGIDKVNRPLVLKASSRFVGHHRATHAIKACAHGNVREHNGRMASSLRSIELQEDGTTPPMV